MTLEARFHVEQGDFVLDADLSVPALGVTSLFGPSGSGKTTLLRAIAGLERHRGGSLRVGGVVWQDGERFVPPHRRSLGFVFQEASLFPHLTVRRNLEYGLDRVPDAERRISLDDAVGWLGVEPLLERRPATLSGGERQRVAIARALAASPGLLLMDEPLAALDEASRQEILPCLESLFAELEIPVIYVSHTSSDTARLADHMILLDAGRVVATGAIDEMLTRLDLPLARGRDAAAVLEAVVTGHDEEFHLTALEFDGERLTVTRREELSVGDRVRLSVAARDVSLTLERQSGTSIRNIVPATVDELIGEGEARVTVRLIAGGVPLLSRITRKSAVELGLAPGRPVYAQVKTVVLLG